MLAFFADKAIDLGGAKNGDDLLARFDLEGHAGTGFALGIGFAMIAPEPGTGGLLIVGLMWLAAVAYVRCGDWIAVPDQPPI
ncbi:MAG: hypothetical protein E6J87_24060 [Deltaproteobacteria bacterium]|nr:MAG: hypothetical protein E6J87_24060 [Deltaproteobacteria bacterium]